MPNTFDGFNLSLPFLILIPEYLKVDHAIHKKDPLVHWNWLHMCAKA